jgi:hypothetical protein
MRYIRRHLIEHLLPKFALRFLQESFRVLKRGGVLRLATPDLEKLAFEYLKNLYQACSGDLGARDRHEWLLIEMFDQFSRESSGGLMLEYWKRTPMPCEDYVLERLGEEVRNFLSVFRATKSTEGRHESEPEAPVAGGLPSETLTFERRESSRRYWFVTQPLNAPVFCVDEKSAIKELDRLDPVLPLSPGRAERYGIEYYRMERSRSMRLFIPRARR